MRDREKGAGGHESASSGLALTTVSLGLAAGLYAWVAGGRVPSSLAEAGSSQADPLLGLGMALVIGFAAAILVVVALTSAAGPQSPWHGRLVWAAGGLYLAGGASALGAPALLLAPAVMIAHLVFQASTGKEPKVESLLLALHTGGFATALCFFHQWPRYQPGWDPFVKNFEALMALWF